MTNKNPGTDIGVQTEDQKSKAAKPLALTATSNCYVDPDYTNHQNETETCLLLFYIPHWCWD